MVRPASPALAKAAAMAEISRLRHINLHFGNNSRAREATGRNAQYTQLLDPMERAYTVNKERQSTSSLEECDLDEPWRSAYTIGGSAHQSAWGLSLLSLGISPSTSLHRPLNLSALHETYFVAVVVLAQFMALAALGQAIASGQDIAETLHVHNPGEEAWFTAAYSLTVGTFILIAGRLGDILGHKRVFVFAYFWLGAWSCFTGFSAYVGRQIFFDVCRAMQGTGAAMLAPNALALLGRAYPPGNKKNMVFALFGAMAPWGFVVGACLASAFSELAWWPWTFWSYGIAAWALCALATLAVPKALAFDAQMSGRSYRPGMDWSGSVLGVVGLVLLNVGLNNGPMFGWANVRAYCPLIIGGLAIVGFIWVETKTLSPLLPLRTLNGTVTWTLALLGFGWGSFGIWLWYGWRFLVETRGQRALTVSTEYTPALVCGLLAAGASGFMLTHTPVSFTMMVAMLAFFAGELIAATQPVVQSYWKQMFISIILMPFGMDMSFPSGSVVLSNHMPLEHQGLAASLVNTVVNYSIAIALAVAGIVEAQIHDGDSTKADVELEIRSAQYTGVIMAGIGLILGMLFCAKTLMKDGWNIQLH